jgi:hypothetical protein
LQYAGVRNETDEKPRTTATRPSIANQRRAQQVEYGKRKQAEAQNDGAEHKFQTPNVPQTTGQRV